MPSPAITAPLPASILVPGPVTVEFTRCLACVEDMDTTQASIFDVDTEETIVTETLQPRTNPGLPRDGTEPFELPEEGSFAAVVLHTALRDQRSSRRATTSSRCARRGARATRFRSSPARPPRPAPSASPSQTTTACSTRSVSASRSTSRAQR